MIRPSGFVIYKYIVEILKVYNAVDKTFKVNNFAKIIL